MDHTIWINFDEDTWLHLPHATYVTTLDPLVDLGPIFPKAVANIVSASSTTLTHTPRVLTPTYKLIG